MTRTERIADFLEGLCLALLLAGATVAYANAVLP
jgi:hypothetical protein